VTLCIAFLFFYVLFLLRIAYTLVAICQLEFYTNIGLWICIWISIALLLERDYVTFRSLLSQIRLSVCPQVVTFVQPTHRVEAFGNISSPLCTLAIFSPPYKILRRSSQIGALNARGVTKQSHGGPIEGCIS